ncbi:MAG TPA: HdeD family acid-resistance protein [Pseudolabrys sp.]|nr:HdeD family acid-resistance protein [Pseudolabrys sp.]
MSSTLDVHFPHSTEAELEPLRAKSGWIVALGVVYTVVGVIALGSVVTATAATVFLVGIMMVIAGAAEIINAFQIKSWGGFLMWLLLGALYVVAGFITFSNPLLAAAVLTLLLGAALVVSGVTRIIIAFSMREGAPWGWAILSGCITLLLGLVVVAHWPVSSLYILGIFLGVDLVMAGVAWIGIGLGLRSRI